MKRVLVTSGPTRAYLDSIRYIANTSSGALGARVVEALLERGLPVVHVYGIGGERPDVEDTGLLESICVSIVQELIDAVKNAAERWNIGAVVHAMAVLDYIPESRVEGKKPSGEECWDVRLKRSPKVIALIRELLPAACTVGFKLENGIPEDELINRAGLLLDKYNLDLVVANLLERVDDSAHEAFFVGHGKEIKGRFFSKSVIAAKLADFIAERL